MARFDSGGKLDTGFGPHGIAGVPGHTATGFNRLVVQPDAKVLVAGSGVVFDPCCSFDAYVARYSGESVPDTTPPVLTVPSRLVDCNVENESACSYHAECSRPLVSWSRRHRDGNWNRGFSIANAAFG